MAGFSSGKTHSRIVIQFEIHINVCIEAKPTEATLKFDWKTRRARHTTQTRTDPRSWNMHAPLKSLNESWRSQSEAAFLCRVSCYDVKRICATAKLYSFRSTDLAFHAIRSSIKTKLFVHVAGFSEWWLSRHRRVATSNKERMSAWTRAIDHLSAYDIGPRNAKWMCVRVRMRIKRNQK